MTDRSAGGYLALMHASAPAVPEVEHYSRSLDRDGFSVVSWLCPACGAKHVEDHEVCEGGVRCCACGGDFALGIGTAAGDGG